MGINNKKLLSVLVHCHYNFFIVFVTVQSWLSITVWRVNVLSNQSSGFEIHLYIILYMYVVVIMIHCFNGS